MLKRLLTVEFLFFLLVGWLVFCAYFFVWLFWYAGMQPFSAITWLSVTCGIYLGLHALCVLVLIIALVVAYYKARKNRKGAK